MTDLFQRDLVDDSALDFTAPVPQQSPTVSPEEGTLALLGQGVPLASPEMEEAHKQIMNMAAIGDRTAIDSGKQKVLKDKADKITGSHLAMENVDLEGLQRDLRNNKVTTAEWKAWEASKSVTRQLLESQEAPTEEKAEQIRKTVEGLTSFSVKQQALGRAQVALDTMLEEMSIGSILGDLGLAILEPFAESATLANVAGEVTGVSSNLTGILLPSVSVDLVSEHMSNKTPADQAAILDKMVSVLVDRQNQFGIGENQLTNAAVLGTLINTIKEVRTEEGFLGMKNVDDLALNGLVIFDALGAADLGRAGKTIFRRFFGKMFGKAKPIATSASDILKVKVAPSLNPDVDVISKRGSLGDVLEQGQEGTIETILKTTKEGKIDEVLDGVGLDVEAIKQRAGPKMTGHIDDTSLPPRTTNPRLKELEETFQGGFDINLIGPASNRGVRIAELQKELVEATKGYPHIDKSFVKPPKDNLSLGTAVMRFGKNSKEGFDDVAQAELLVSNFKAQGETAKLIQGKGKAWVEVERKHVLSGKDAGVFSNVTGEKLTVERHRINRGLFGWSESVNNIGEGMHPQAMFSWSKDLSGQIKSDLIDVAKPFFKVAEKLDQTHIKNAWRAIAEGEKLALVFDAGTLRRRYPGISKDAIEAYRSYRATADGMQMIRSSELRKKLARGNHKQLTVGDTEFFGHVMPEKPTLSVLKVDEAGEPLTKELIEGNVVQGSHIFDPVSNTSIPLTQDFLDSTYETGGRVVKLSSKFESGLNGDGSYSHLVIRSLKDIDIQELPQFPNYGRKGYAVERFYDTEGQVIIETGVARKLNGVEVKGSETIGIVKTQGQAKKLANYLRNKHAGRTFEIKDSRELKNLLDESAGGNGGQSWLKKRREQALIGKIGKNGLPEEDTLLSVGEAFQKSIHNTAQLPITQTEEILSTRWMNQYSKYMKGTKQGEGFPNTLDDIWDNLAIEKDGIDPAVLKNDANTLHYNISAIRSERISEGVRAVRADLARMAKSMGANDNFIAEIASESLTKAAKSNPVAKSKGITSLMSIAYGMGFQLPQNVFSAFGLMATQGFDGLRAMKDSYHLIRGLQTIGKGVDYDVIVSKLAKRFNVSESEANMFVKRAKESGIFGNSGDLDNLLRFATHATHIKSGRLASLANPIKKLGRGVTSLVAKSIDLTMLGWWSAAYRKQLKHFKGPKHGQDFWESVRQTTRDFTQNQNSSDLLAFEKQGNPLGIAMQFTQHLMKLGHQGTKIIAKAGGANVNTVFASSQAEALRTVAIYFGVFGAGGLGRTGLQFMHEQLPKDLANPKTPEARALSNAVMGGLFDVILNSATEDPISISSGISPGGSIDNVVNYYSVIQKMVASGELSIDAIDALGGATVSTFSNITNAFKAIPPIIKSEVYDTPEKLMRAVQVVAKVAKTGGDINLGFAMNEMEARFSKMSGKVSGRAGLKAAIWKTMGFNQYASILDQGQNKEDYLERTEHKALTDALVKSGRRLFMDIVKADDPESLDKWRALVQEEVNAVGNLAITNSERERVTNTLTDHWIKVLIGDKGMLERLGGPMKDIKPYAELLEDYARSPDTSPEQAAAAENIIATITEAQE